MSGPSPKTPAPRCAADDWFYDELMTAQPEATRDFFRARLMRMRTPRLIAQAAQQPEPSEPQER
jgi:hypothetical protein